ncbi:potassium channel protein [Stieleria sp. TO1_6]|uniref:potassium channel protein n=1 Tax=Stieleria tagensis TaxID=2956795 RepID=UPI00209B6E3F|nr:potassium channel protein [Stieleria tagensis]MCO8124861.1 potassium channel protein [Stieleria tagensis]
MQKRFDTKHWLRWFAGRNEKLMFTLAVVYLVCVAFLVVIWVDVPNLQERARNIIHRSEAEHTHLVGGVDVHSDRGIDDVVLVVMAGVWCVVWVEAGIHWCTRPWNREMRRHHLYSLLFCLCPALRMCARSPEMNGRIWLPGMGWRRGGRRLQRQLERHFSVPMMIIALLIMPILITEFFLKDQVAAYGWLRMLMHIGTGVIWFAFAAEFILMVSIAEKKLDYCKEHWIDLAIVILPLIWFLRSLSLARMLRVADMVRIQQLTNVARAYRLRGTALKAFRVLILFDLTERILRISDDRKIEKLETELAELDKRSRFLRQKIAKLKYKESAATALDPVADPPPSDQVEDDCRNDPAGVSQSV